MRLTDISGIRLTNQHVVQQNPKTVKELVAWMGAMQAQDYDMLKWALGVRLPGSSVKTVMDAIDKGEIIRTHLMRPTWHIVSAEDIYWMLELTAPQIISSSRSRQKQLGITPAIIHKCNKIITKTIEDQGGHALRDEIVANFKKANIDLGDNRAAHLLILAELEGLICSGKNRNKKPTYALLEERVPNKVKLTCDEALNKLARSYFNSHGPAMLEDFVWWSGLPVKDARNALEMVKSNFVSETIDSKEYWFTDSQAGIDSKNGEAVHLLPSYDEFLISYKDRTASINPKNQKEAVSNNGIFYPIIVVNGKVSGMWKRTTKKDKVIIETNFFKSPTQKVRKLIEQKAVSYGNFMEKETEIVHGKS